MIGLWNTAEQGFQIGTQLLTIELEDVYFLTALSKRGAPIFLSGQRELPVPIEEYLANHCIQGLRLVGGSIAIRDVRDLPLRSILFSITSLEGSTISHLVSILQMAYDLQCLDPTVFNWSATFLQNVKADFEMQYGVVKVVWIWFVSGFVLPRTYSSDETIDFINSTTGG
jgi:hypothetical protein